MVSGSLGSFQGQKASAPGLDDMPLSMPFFTLTFLSLLVCNAPGALDLEPGGNEAGTHGQLELCHQRGGRGKRRLILGQPRLGSR